MFNVNGLPDLVIYTIIKQMCNMCIDEEDFGERLPLLAINRKIRQIGIPLVYDSFLMELSGEFDIIAGNGRLYQNPEFRAYVKSVKLGDKSSEFAFGDMTIILIHCLNGLSDTVKLKIPQNEVELFEMAPLVVEKFVETFPNIQSINVWTISVGVNSEKKLALKWIDMLSSQLTAFHCNLPLANTNLQPTLQLTQYTFNCNLDAQTVLPNVNPRPLKYLRIIDPPRNFPWQCFQPTNGLLVFPNLSTLKISYNKERHQSERLNTRISNPLRVQFPELKAFDGKVINQEGIGFKPEAIPAHMNIFKLCVDEIGLWDFGVFPFKSVKCLDIDIFKHTNVIDDGFYSTTNSLLGDQIVVTDEPIIHIDTELFQHLDFERIQWTNLREVILLGPCIEFCLQHLDKLPSIKILSLMKTESFHTNPETPVLPQGPLTQLENHGLDRINFGDSDEWKLEAKVGIAMLLAKSLKKLKICMPQNPESGPSCPWSVLSMPNPSYDMLKKELSKAVEQYPHLDNIKVSDILE